jgi:hypothetical protein
MTQTLFSQVKAQKAWYNTYKYRHQLGKSCAKRLATKNHHANHQGIGRNNKKKDDEMWQNLVRWLAQPEIFSTYAIVFTIVTIGVPIVGFFLFIISMKRAPYGKTFLDDQEAHGTHTGLWTIFKSWEVARKGKYSPEVSRIITKTYIVTLLHLAVVCLGFVLLHQAETYQKQHNLKKQPASRTSTSHP